MIMQQKPAIDEISLKAAVFIKNKQFVQAIKIFNKCFEDRTAEKISVESLLLAVKAALLNDDVVKACSFLEKANTILFNNRRYEDILKLWVRVGSLSLSKLSEVIKKRQNNLLDEISVIKPEWIIDIEKQYQQNCQWLEKANRGFLLKVRGAEKNILPSLTKLAVKIENTIYYCCGLRWAESWMVPFNVYQDVLQDTVLFWLRDIGQFCSLTDVYQKNKNIEAIKHSQYVVMDRNTAFISLFVGDFLKFGPRNEVFKFLLKSDWKKTINRQDTLLPKAVICDRQLAEEEKINIYFEQRKEKLIKDFYFWSGLLEKQYGDDFLKSVWKKINNGKRPRVLFLTSRYTSYLQYATMELMDGFKQAGCPSLVFKERRNQGVGFTFIRLFKVIDRWKPDIIVSVDNFCGKKIRQAMPKIPFISWIIDPPQHINKPQQIGENDYLFITSSSLKEKLTDAYPFLKEKKASILPLVFNPKVYRHLDCEKKYDVSYISHLRMIPEIESYYKEDQKTNSREEKVIHLVIEKINSMNRLDVLKIINEKQYLNQFIDILLRYLGYKISEQQRESMNMAIGYYVAHFCLKTQPIKYLIENGVKNLIVGGSGWEKIPFFKPYSIGVVSHGEKLNLIYNQTKINLNISPQASFHPKVGEIFGARGFILTSDKAEYDIQRITEYYIEDKEVILFKTYDDLLEKVKFYLDNEKERQAIADKAHRKAMSVFTTKQAAEKMIKTVFELGLTDER